MPYAIEYAPTALRDLERLDSIYKKLIADIEKLAGNPRPHGFKQLDTKEKRDLSDSGCRFSGARS
jgi:mRNA-degrading endonuclease RelE of RelBE toxin-antitoxin system